MAPGRAPSTRVPPQQIQNQKIISDKQLSTALPPTQLRRISASPPQSQASLYNTPASVSNVTASSCQMIAQSRQTRAQLCQIASQPRRTAAPLLEPLPVISCTSPQHLCNRANLNSCSPLCSASDGIIARPHFKIPSRLLDSTNATTPASNKIYRYKPGGWPVQKSSKRRQPRSPASIALRILVREICMEQDIAYSIRFKQYALDTLQEAALLFLNFQLEAVDASAESTNAARTQEEIRQLCTIMRIVAPTTQSPNQKHD